MKILKLALLCLAILLQSAAFAQVNLGGREFLESAVPLETIVSRYLAWRGGPAYEGLQSFHAKSEIDAIGRPLAAEIWADRSGCWRRNLVTQPNANHGFGSTSKSSWVADLNGQIENDPARSAYAYRLALIDKFKHRPASLREVCARVGCGFSHVLQEA